MKLDTVISLPRHPVPYAVLGFPIHHSLSPLMQQAAFDHVGILARYYRVEVDEAQLPTALLRMKQIGSGGWNCTVPLKVTMFINCDRRAESAEKFQAVNTVVRDPETSLLIGHNTDGTGWSLAMREASAAPVCGLRILLLGAGGAGRAIATQALMEGCGELVIANRDQGRGLALLQQLEGVLPSRCRSALLRLIPLEPESLRPVLAEVDLVVNATSGSLSLGQPPVLSAEQLRPGLFVYDTVYGPAAQALQEQARLAGASWSDGIGMLLHQGAEAFRLWTQKEAPLEIMRAALLSATDHARAAAQNVVKFSASRMLPKRP